jgi:DNA-binding transcriptional MerR regulator
MTTEPDTTPPRTVAELAELAGVTVRTLHHYDQVGLLVPSTRSDAGYRLYSTDDLARLREILVWRRLDVPLAEIARLLDDPDADRVAVLRAQHALVRTRRRDLEKLERALAAALDHETRSPDMSTDQDIIDALDGFDPADHDAEARERWGDTDAYRESARRTKDYHAEQWREIKDEAAEVATRLAELFAAGEAAAGVPAMDAAEAHRAHVTRWFYDCSPAIHRGLGAMYVADPRFADHWDDRAPGLAAFARDAFAANADRLERD